MLPQHSMQGVRSRQSSCCRTVWELFVMQLPKVSTLRQGNAKMHFADWFVWRVCLSTRSTRQKRVLQLLLSWRRRQTHNIHICATLLQFVAVFISYSFFLLFVNGCLNFILCGNGLTRYTTTTLLRPLVRKNQRCALITRCASILKLLRKPAS